MLTKTNARLQELALSIGRLEEERKALAEDIADKYAEAKAEGYTVSALRKAIKIHAMDADKYAEAKAVGYTVSALRKAIKIHAMDADKREKHEAEQLDLELYLAQIEGREVDMSVEAAE